MAVKINVYCESSNRKFESAQYSVVVCHLEIFLMLFVTKNVTKITKI
jgi:hypothetical protein